METGMAVMTIRNIDDAIKNRLRVRAAMHGRSMEDEARDILRSALSAEVPRPRNLGQAIHQRFSTLGGVDLPNVPREAIRPAVDFGE
jgi:plasmid stability protein